MPMSFRHMGQGFSKPVTLTFHYMDIVECCAMRSEIGIAFQDANGFWHRAWNIVSDSVNKTIFCNDPALHSVLNFSQGTTIVPILSIVHLKKSVQLYLTLLKPKITMTMIDVLNGPEGLSASWMVEGIVNGNASVGKIST